MSNDPTMRRKGTALSGLALLLLALVIIGCIGAIVYVLVLNPQLLADILYVIAVAIAAIIAICVIAYIVITLIAIPMYMVKGESYQGGKSYSLDDVKSVKEDSSEDHGED